MGRGWSFINEVSRINKREYGSTKKTIDGAHLGRISG
jgi:hypothetical protein